MDRPGHADQGPGREEFGGTEAEAPQAECEGEIKACIKGVVEVPLGGEDARGEGMLSSYTLASDEPMLRLDRSRRTRRS